MSAPAMEPMDKMKVEGRQPGRIQALDFTKGALVLVMVLYHWLNYFYRPQGDIYTYLRFLTPSFIFITGFLVSNVYISKYKIGDPRPPRRLFQRGLKILGVFVGLNVIRTCSLSETSRAQILSEHLSLHSLLNLYVIGSGGSGGQAKTVAFFVLVPIGYLLLLSSLLLIACRFYKHIFYVTCAVALLSAFTLELKNLQSTNLELIAIGLLGVIVGYTPIETIDAIVLKYPVWILVAYACYLAAITLWNATYPLQIVGVFLSLMIIYLLGAMRGAPGKVRSRIIVLGKYSLLGYIAQIAVLQLLHGGLRYIDGEAVALVISFVAAFALTFLVIETTDRARARVRVVDKLYRTVFA